MARGVSSLADFSRCCSPKGKGALYIQAYPTETSITPQELSDTTMSAHPCKTSPWKEVQRTEEREIGGKMWVLQSAVIGEGLENRASEESQGWGPRHSNL